MKSFKLMFIALISFIIIFSRFTRIPSTIIKGTVSPTDAATKVTAISKTDTFSTAVMNGMFVISDLKPGLYYLFVEAKAPYKNGSRQDVSVVAGNVTDVGEIKLEK